MVTLEPMYATIDKVGKQHKKFYYKYRTDWTTYRK